MELKDVRKAYKRYAPVYDLLFGAAMRDGRRRVAQAINRQGPGRVLEVGVGTGLSLPLYGADQRIVGIDVSAEMLDVARRRVAEERLGNVEALLEMDAARLAFRDGAFDVVVAMYVMSVVPDPAACLAEIKRVCRPGGAIYICNHFLDEGEAKGLSRLIAPLGAWLGWRPDFTLQSLLGGGGLNIVRKQAVPPFRLFSLLECVNA